MAASTPTILDSRGQPMKYFVGEYEASRNTRERKLHGTWDYNTRPETEMLPFTDRKKIISYLRRSLRNNPVVAALAFRYALAIGSPTVHAITTDGGFNDEKERALERRLRSIMHGCGWSWHRMNKIISVETLIAGEVFAVEVDDKIQLIPSELCGSPAKPDENEFDGIIYDETGVPLFYRFGVRKQTTNQGQSSVVSFEEKDGAQLIPAEFVSHIGSPMRIEERRFSPILSSVIAQIQNLDDIIKAKVTTVKNQSAMSMFFTKNFDPGMFAESSALSSTVEQNGGTILAQSVARSSYQDIKNGSIMYGEVGEDVKLIEPSLNAQDFSSFALMLLDQICAPTGLFPEEVLVGYRNSNYSSARADRIRLTDVLKDIRREREVFCDRVIERQTAIAVDSGEIPIEGDGIADISYGWPVVREIDETKHVLAQGTALANGSKSLDDVCAENGKFADQVQQQVVRSAVRWAKNVRAYAMYAAPTKEQIEAQQVTAQEIMAYMPNATAASEAINALANADAAAVNAEANAARANTQSPTV
jgi:capsid protein